MKLRMETWDAAWLRMRTRSEAEGDTLAVLTENERLGEMAKALDDSRPKVLEALEVADMGSRTQPWRSSLSELVEAAVQKRRQHSRRRQQSRLHKRAQAYRAAKPGQVIPLRPQVFLKREHWCGIGCGMLPEDRQYSERELNRLISGVGNDFAHVRRFLVDEGWLERSRSTYRLTDLGRRAMRMEHAMAENCRRSRPHVE
jgi:hypothetical protein